MSSAGDNENSFIKRMGCNENKENNIKGKLFFGNRDDANISIDGHFEHKKRFYLVEIDSGNEAKLLAGQYILLNALYDKSICNNYSIENVVFLVIHYYKGYEPERTKKTIKKIKDVFKTKMQYMAFHQNDIKSWEDFISKIDNKSN